MSVKTQYQICILLATNLLKNTELFNYKNKLTRKDSYHQILLPMRRVAPTLIVFKRL